MSLGLVVPCRCQKVSTATCELVGRLKQIHEPTATLADAHSVPWLPSIAIAALKLLLKKELTPQLVKPEMVPYPGGLGGGGGPGGGVGGGESPIASQLSGNAHSSTWQISGAA